MSFSIRRTLARDARALPDIERAAAGTYRALPDLAWVAEGETMSVARHFELLSEGTHWVATDRRKRLLGFVAAEREVNAIHVCEMSVHSDSQRQGIGAALLRAVIDHADGCDLPAVTLTTFRDVPWNAPYYARLGFRLIEKRSLDARLATILAVEAEYGLPAERRCAMQYSLLDTALAPMFRAR